MKKSLKVTRRVGVEESEGQDVGEVSQQSGPDQAWEAICALAEVAMWVLAFIGFLFVIGAAK